MADGSGGVGSILSLLIYRRSVSIESSSNVALRRLRSLASLMSLEILGSVHLEVSLPPKCGLELMAGVAMELEVILEAVGDLGQAVQWTIAHRLCTHLIVER